MKRIVPLIAFCLVASGSALVYLQQQHQGTTEKPESVINLQSAQPPFTQASSVSGAYLAGRYAQRHFDWSAAGTFIDQVLHEMPNDPALIKRAMVLAMGAGDVDKGIALAKRAEEAEGQPSALAELFMAVGDFKTKNYQSASAHINKMPPGGLSDFILPLLKSWCDAALGKSNTQSLDQNTIHLYHAILINDFLGKPEHIETLLSKALNAPGLSLEDIIRIADLYADIGNAEKARQLYQEALALDSENPDIERKLENLSKGEAAATFVHVKTAEAGVSEALYDMARLLAQEYSDESARVFAQMAIYLNPEASKNRFLLASIAARNNRTAEAIEIYRSIGPEDLHYAEARRTAADLLESSERKGEALDELKNLAETKNDVDAMVQIGDIYRLDEDFDKAIKAYTKAEDMLGGKIGPDYWHLLYVRGMAYEQNKQWKKAEEDLQLALQYQPGHPYLLNYLGYAWADQGVNLGKALEMIERAVSLRPDDGYITDSLGWVYYRMGEFAEAVPYLEQAVELMPYDATINDHLGDAYWNVGRKREARFQWERAKNHAEDPVMIESLEAKIVDGLPPVAQQKDHKAEEPKILKSENAQAIH